MSLIIKYFYKLLTSEGAFPDGPQNALPLTRSPMPIVLINIAYLAFVFKIGPWYMRNRKPLRLKRVLLVYNLAQVIFCLIYGLVATYNVVRYYNFNCMVKWEPDHPLKYIEVRLTYSFYLLKLVDYLDTIFFVLRKSYKQVTFLHVFHHMTMFTGGYIHIKSYGYGGAPASMTTLNSFVHVIMYGYYFISALRPNMKQSLHWKKHITQVQIGQFVLLLGKGLLTIISRPDCSYPRVWLWVGVVLPFLMILMFGDFYRKAYLNTPNKRSGVKLEKKIL